MKKNILIISAILALSALILFAILSSGKSVTPAELTAKSTSTTTLAQTTTSIASDSATTVADNGQTKVTSKTQATTKVQFINSINKPSRILFYEQDKPSTIEDTNSDIKNLLLKWSNQEMKQEDVTLNSSFIMKEKRLNKPIEIIYLKEQNIIINIAHKFYKISYTKILIPTKGDYKNHLFFFSNNQYKYGGYIVATLFKSDNSLYDIINKK